MKNNQLKWMLFTIFIIAFSLRLSAVLNQEEIKKILRSDDKEYDEMAVNLTSGNGFSQLINDSVRPVTRRVPVYPLFLAFIYSIFGHSYIAVKIIQAVIGALFCIIIFYITYMMYGDELTGFVASAFTALYKPFVSGFSFYGGPTSLLSEYFYMFILGLTILITMRFIKYGDIKFGVLSGIFMGLTILTRPEFVLFSILLAIYLFYISKLSLKRFFKKYFIIYLFITLTMTSWVARNYVIFKEFIPLTTLEGYIFFLGNNSSAKGGWIFKDKDFLESVQNSKNLSDAQKSRIFFKAGMKELTDNPKRISKLFIKKILVHWAPFEERFKIFNPFYAFILIFGSIGILFFRKRLILENVLLIIFLSTTLIAVLTFGEPRYRYSYEPYLIIFAALAISELIKKINSHCNSDDKT